MQHHEKTIELELRAEVQIKEIEIVKARLERFGNIHSHTQRLSVMYFGSVENKKIDIRVRVTNGQSEVVVKFGSFGAHDRIEVAQAISQEQFIGFVKIFSQFGFASKVGERETFNYSLPNNVMASLVVAGSIAYIEIEKISSPEQAKENTKKLHNIAERFQLDLLKSEDDFDELCKRLDEKVDWLFLGSADNYKHLEESLKKYLK